MGLLSAYRRGLFPMADEASGEIRLYTADPRGIMPLTPDEGFHTPRSVERTIRTGRFRIEIDRDFEAVMRGCAPSRDPNDGAWINETLITWYTMLFDAGHAHCIAAYRDDDRLGTALVGGIYGVSLGAAFFGESMFCTPKAREPDGSRHPHDGTDASKVCLVTLVRLLADRGYDLFDTQMVTDHVRRFGGEEISLEEYLVRLADAVAQHDHWNRDRR